MKPHWTLIGFVAVAAAIAVAEWRSPEDTDHKTIVVDENYRNFIREQLSQPSGSLAVQMDFDEALQKFLEEEVLYREGMKLGLHQDDLIVKRRVVQKMRFLMEDMTPLQKPDDAQLAQWLGTHAERYRTGREVAMEHVFLSRAKRGDGVIEEARTLATQLRAGQAAAQSDPFPLPSGLSSWDEDRLRREFGSRPTEQILALQPGVWSDPIQSGLGVHLVKVQSVSAGRTLTLNEARLLVQRDLEAAQREEVNRASVQALMSQYRVVEQP